MEVVVNAICELCRHDVLQFTVLTSMASILWVVLYLSLSDCFYDAGWTEDLRAVINHLHEYPNAPLFVVGMSMGAKFWYVKYLGEDGDSIPVAGAVAICSPWDLLISDGFIRRRLLQKIYDKVLAIGLQGYVQLHRPIFSRLANWEGIKKSRSIRDFDYHATRLVRKFETVDTYYGHCSSVSYVGNVSVPLLCISALDDPVCTREAIPWDECRWVRAVDEFLRVLHCSQHMHVKKVVSDRYWEITPDVHLPV
ncbi:embryogenesis-associated protein EMB8-like [Rosa rugosa]|uniref:embryogenesis-associated protein EMB8-like n=1 Tax=Rosa rugosa TaxID=74645 RepID=UPI002B416888|nr:embryogenesis-associated protein EMB8-like [Rosa rugosa]